MIWWLFSTMVNNGLNGFKEEIEKIITDTVPNPEKPYITEYDKHNHFGVVRLIEKVKTEKNLNNFSEVVL